MNLLADEKLHWSPIVVNSRMNRERNASGINSYEQEFRFAPQQYLHSLLSEKERVKWLDLCCGKGNALIQTARYFSGLDLATKLSLEGIDLIDTFPHAKEDFPCLHFTAIPIASWEPLSDYDLITCVHGLHYLGDKLGVIAKAIAALAPDGLFIANLDLQNIRIDGQPGDRYLKKLFKTHAIAYDAKRRLIKKKGSAQLHADLDYLGADDSFGPNYTGQDAVLSHYRRTTISR